MLEEGLPPNVISYAAAIAANRDKPKVSRTIYIYLLSSALIHPYLLCNDYNPRYAHSQVVIELLARMKKDDVAPNTVVRCACGCVRSRAE